MNWPNPNQQPAVLAIDQGTTNSKAFLVDPDGRVLAGASARVEVDDVRPGWVEQDPEQIWRSVVAAVSGVLAARHDTAVVGIALSTQRESVLGWRRSTGEPLGPLLGWQDRRTTSWCDDLGARVPGSPSTVLARTGLRIDPMFSAPKLRWVLEHAARRVPPSDVCLGTVDAWLVWQLTGGAVHACDAGNASRTLLYDVTELRWSAELAAIFGIPLAMLPQVRRSDARYGGTRGLVGVPDGTPITSVLADSHAALYGQGGGDVPGVVKATYGTGSSVMTPVGRISTRASGVPTTLAWLTDRPTYAREGNILSSGSALTWTSRLLGLDSVADLLELAGSVPSSSGVQLLPAFTGLGAPHWDRSVRAQLTGMSQATGPAQIARAAVDAVAHQVCDVIEAITADGTDVAVLRADGGATRSSLLMQTQADLLGLVVEVADVAEISAVGAARLAWRSLGEGGRWQTGAPAARYAPSIDEAERRRRRAAWTMSVQTARARPDGDARSASDSIER